MKSLHNKCVLTSHFYFVGGSQQFLGVSLLLDSAGCVHYSLFISLNINKPICYSVQLDGLDT